MKTLYLCAAVISFVSIIAIRAGLEGSATGLTVEHTASQAAYTSSDVADIELRIINTSRNEIRVKEIGGSCGCMTPVPSRPLPQILKPGEQLKVNLAIVLAGRSGFNDFKVHLHGAIGNERSVQSEVPIRLRIHQGVAPYPFKLAIERSAEVQGAIVKTIVLSHDYGDMVVPVHLVSIPDGCSIAPLREQKLINVGSEGAEITVSFDTSSGAALQDGVLEFSFKDPLSLHDRTVNFLLPYEFANRKSMSIFPRAIRFKNLSESHVVQCMFPDTDCRLRIVTGRHVDARCQRASPGRHEITVVQRELPAEDESNQESSVAVELIDKQGDVREILTLPVLLYTKEFGEK